MLFTFDWNSVLGGQFVIFGLTGGVAVTAPLSAIEDHSGARYAAVDRSGARYTV